jgi:hypothetical protein
MVTESHPIPPRRIFRVALFAVLLGAGSPRVALASGAEFYTRIEYRADSLLRGCWDEAELRRRVTRQLGYDPFHDAAAVSVRIQVGGSAKAIGGQVEWKDGNGKTMGERRFVAKDGNCARLLSEMAFAVSLQIQLLRPPANATPDVPPVTESDNAGDASASSAATELPDASESPASPPVAPARPEAPKKEALLTSSWKERRGLEDGAQDQA